MRPQNVVHSVSQAEGVSENSRKGKVALTVLPTPPSFLKQVINSPAERTIPVPGGGKTISSPKMGKLGLRNAHRQPLLNSPLSSQLLLHHFLPRAQTPLSCHLFTNLFFTVQKILKLPTLVTFTSCAGSQVHTKIQQNVYALFLVHLSLSLWFLVPARNPNRMEGNFLFPYTYLDNFLTNCTILCKRYFTIKQ